MPAKQKAGACHCSKHAGVARADTQSVRQVCVAASQGPESEQMNACECCGRLRGYHAWICIVLPRALMEQNLHTRLARLLPAAWNPATCSGRRITRLFNSQGTPKSAGTSISQGPTSNSLEQTYLKRLRDKKTQQNRVLFTPFKGKVGHKKFGSFKGTHSTQSPDCKYKIMKLCHVLNHWK